VDYTFSDDPGLVDLDVVHAYLAEESYWARGIPRAVLERAVANSLCIGAYLPGGELAAFARVVTDRATFGWLCDLFVVPAHRGRGLGRQLVRAVHAHPDLQGLRRFMLATADAHGLYRGEGYGPVQPELLMEISYPPERVYPADQLPVER